jgi:hypothetical protein
MDILALLQCLQPTVTKTTLRQCSRIVLAMLVMTGRGTMLGLSRWAGTGGSYRTVGLDHGVGHLVSMTTEKTHGSISIGIEIR